MARINPIKSPEERSADSTEEMARLAVEAHFPNVAQNLKNLAQRRRTVANMKKPSLPTNLPSTVPQPSREV